MATAIYGSLIDHSPLDGTNDAINGSEVDANPYTLAQLLDGTATTDLAQDGTIDFRFTSTRAGVRVIDTDNAGAAIHYGLVVEWDPVDGLNMTDGSSGVGIQYLMPDDADTQTIYARHYILMVNDAAAADAAEVVWETAVGGTLTVETLRYGASGLFWNDDGNSALDVRFETDNFANAFIMDAGLDVFAFGGAAVDDVFLGVTPPARTSTAATNTYHLNVAAGGAVTIPAGTTTYVGSVNIEEPNITATGTVTNAFTVRIAAAPTEGGTTNYALWVDAGAVQFDSTLAVTTSVTTAAVLASSNDSGAIGASGTGFSDIFFALGAVINFDGGDVTQTHAANTLTWAGASSGYLFNDGLVIIGDGTTTTHGGMTLGLLIDGRANDNSHFGLLNADVTHVLTTGAGLTVLTTQFLSISKRENTLGGAHFHSFSEDGALVNTLKFSTYGGTASTGKTTGANALVEFYVAEHNGANALANITADGNVFGVIAEVGGTQVMRFMVDEDGDIYSVTAAQTFDAYDDVAMLSAYDATIAPDQIIRTEWEDFARYNEATLIECGVLGAPVADGGMTNVTHLQRLHNGAIRQLGRGQAEIRAELNDRREQIALLEAELNTLKARLN